MSKTSRRQFLIGTALASVAALTATHRQTHLPVDKSLTDNESWFFRTPYDGPTFTVLTTGPTLPLPTTLDLVGPHGSRVMYRTGETITQERAASMTSEDSGPVLYDRTARMMQRLHEVHDPMGQRSDPHHEMPLSLTRRHAGVRWPDHGGHWS